MHQGNLFVEPVSPQQDESQLLPGLIAVDFGIMGRLDHETRQYLADILFGFLTQDYVKVAEAHFDAGYVSREFPVQDFAQALRAIGEPVFGQTADVISMAKLLTQLFDTTETFNMHMQPQLVLLQKTMVVVEGVARSLNPQLDMWTVARPVVEDFMKDHVGPDAWVSDAVTGAQRLAKLAARAPQSLERMERAAELLAEMTDQGGLKLHPDTARAIGERQNGSGRAGRLALWVAAIALAVLALRSL
jgi:ubiquinone biosynthesis protein